MENVTPLLVSFTLFLSEHAFLFILDSYHQ
jgi:hypothetical protein